MTEPEILRKYEFDALLAHAVSLSLTDLDAETKVMNNVKLNSRVAQLATLIMVGIENALLANDACGVPIPWQICCPWKYFNGHHLQITMMKAKQCKTVIELCDNDNLMVVRVDNLRSAILEDIYARYAHEPFGFKPSGRLLPRPPDEPGYYRRNRGGGAPAGFRSSQTSSYYGGISYNDRCRLGRGGSYFDSTLGQRPGSSLHPRRRGNSSTHDNNLPRREKQSPFSVQSPRKRGSSERSLTHDSVSHSSTHGDRLPRQEDDEYDDDILPVPGRRITTGFSPGQESNQLPGIGRGVRVGQSSEHVSGRVSGNGRGTLQDGYGRGKCSPRRPRVGGVGKSNYRGAPSKLIEEYERASYELDLVFKDYIEDVEDD